MMDPRNRLAHLKALKMFKALLLRQRRGKNVPVGLRTIGPQRQ